MEIIRGTFRLLTSFLAIGLSTLLILALAWVPIRVRGARLASWLVVWLARFLALLFNVHFTCTDPEKLQQHRGFIFPNHLSFLDIVLLLTIWPMRFVSMAELRTWPFIGWIAMAVETVFVNRTDKASRSGARKQLSKELTHYPAIVLFPEGSISSTGDLQPFRYGAFEIAVQGSVPFVPCIFVYERWDVVGWTDEPLLAVVWRMCKHSGPLRAKLYVRRSVQPTPGDDPRQLAGETQSVMKEMLAYARREYDV